MNSAGNSKPVSFFISAGELSGDMHGAELIREIKQAYSPAVVSFAGLGGNLMSMEGLHSFYHVKELATVGFIDVIKKYRFFKNAIAECAENIIMSNPDAVILIDYPGFNLRLAEEIRANYDGKIIYYISPQLWAWHESRVKKVKKFIDLMLVVFPFEAEFYSKYSVKAVYVGHPLINKVKAFLNNRPPSGKGSTVVKRVTVFPGSRKDEIRMHMPVLLKSLDMLKNDFELDVRFKVSAGMENNFGEFTNELAGYKLETADSLELMSDSDVVLAKAGTSTMECSLTGTPYLIFYKTSPFNYYLLKPIVKVEHLGIMNILAKKEVVKEFIQNDFTAENIYKETKKILSDQDYNTSIRKDLKEVWDILGEENASHNAAHLVKEMAES
jgi:lipid-A-disaccharide synthase